MNTTIKTIIVDDQASCIKRLCEDLASYQEIEIVAKFTSPKKAKDTIVKLRPSLLFLDVEMPGMTGLELLQEIQSLIHPDIYIVFYSAFDKYMLEAFRASAFDFLLKPYTKDELNLVIDRVKNKIKSGHADAINSISELFSGERKFAIYTVTGLLLLRKSEILHFHYNPKGQYWELTKTNLSVFKLRKSTTAKDIIKIDNSFLQVSPDCILNIEYLSSIENLTLRCVLYPPFNGLEIFASRRCYSKIKEILEII